MAEAIVIGGLKFIQGVAAYFGANISLAQAAAVWNTALFTAASTGVNAYISSQREFPNQGSILQAGIQPDMPRVWQIGQRANAGVLVDWHTHGNKNQFLSLVFYLGEGPMQPLRQIIADGRAVWSGTLQGDGTELELTEYRSPDARVWIHYHDGRVGQTVNSYLNSQYSVGANYKATGCAYVVLRVKWDPDTTPAPPQMTFVTDGANLYDRRRDSTAGGTGTHRLNDPSTWEYSNNPAVALDHYLLGNYWPGMTKPRFGVGLDPADVPYDRFAALANLCEETVSLTAGGTQQRYVAQGFLFADQVHASNITELCKAMDARPADFGGKVSAISHDSKTSILTITDDDVVEGSIENYVPKRSWEQLVGGAQGTYQDPSNNFQPIEYPRVDDLAWETEDGGETRTQQFDLPFEVNPARAQRLARLFVNRERRQAVLTGNYGPRVIELEEGDWFTRTGDRFPGGKVFEVIDPPQFDTENMSVTINAIEVDPTDSAWDPADEDAVDLPVGDDSNYVPPTLPAPNVTYSTYDWSFGQYTFSAVRFNHVDFADANLDVDIEIADSDGSGAPSVTADFIDVSIRAGRQYGSYSSLLPGKKYVLRARLRGAARVGAWTAWDEITAGINAQYGPIGTNGATIGTDLFLADGVTVATEPLVVTGQGQAASILGQGALALANDVDWGSTVTGRPVELTDGRVGAGLASNGDLGRPIPSTIKLSSDIMSYLGGGTFIGDLNADLTSANQAASFLNQGSLAVRNDVTWVTDFAAYPGNAAVITAQGQAASILNQGAWATTGFSLADITRMRAANEGLLNNPFFSDPSSPATGVPSDWANWANGTTLTRASRYAGTGYCVAGDATVPGRTNLGLSQTPQVIAPNGLYRMRFQSRRTGGTNAGSGLLVQWLDSGGNYISGVTLACSTLAPIGGSVSAYQDGLQTWDGVVQAPSNAARANVYAMWSWTGMPGYTATDANRFQGEIHEANLYPAGETDRRTNTQTDNADQTSANQAASILNQGFGATAGQSTVDNSYAPFGTNNAFNSKFLGGGSPPVGWRWGSGNNTGMSVIRAVNLSADWSGAENVPYAHIPGTPTSGLYFDLLSTDDLTQTNTSFLPYCMAVQPNERIYASMRLGPHRCNAEIKILYRDQLGGYVTEVSSSQIASNGGGGQGRPDTMGLASIYHTVPANAYYAAIFVRARTTGQANPYVFACQPFITKVQANTTGDLPFHHSASDVRADRTGGNQAASIANQGGQATANATRGSLASRPASPPESSWYVETDNNKLQFYTSGSWYDVADVTPAGAGSPLSATISPAYADGARFGAGTATTNNVTVSVSGGVGPFTFLWEYPPSSGIGISPSLTAATVNFQKSLGTNEHVQTTATVTVTDTGDGNKTVQAQVPINLIAL